MWIVGRSIFQQRTRDYIEWKNWAEYMHVQTAACLLPMNTLCGHLRHRCWHHPEGLERRPDFLPKVTSVQGVLAQQQGKKLRCFELQQNAGWIKRNLKSLFSECHHESLITKSHDKSSTQENRYPTSLSPQWGKLHPGESVIIEINDFNFTFLTQN